MDPEPKSDTPNTVGLSCHFCGHTGLSYLDMHEPGHCKICASGKYEPVFHDTDERTERDAD